jgi:hypothetical protein
VPAFRHANAHQVAFPQYRASTGGDPLADNGNVFGHSPIPIQIEALAVSWVPSIFITNRQDTIFQLWVDGALQGLPIVVGPASPSRYTFDSPVLVPAVTSGNVDGASRFGVSTWQVGGVGDYTESICLLYTPTNVEDDGKEVWGIGAAALIGGDGDGSDGRYAAPMGDWYAWYGNWNYGGVSPLFASPWELSDGTPPPVGGMAEAVAAAPMCRPATWDDFTIALRNDPDGAYRFKLRVNGSTVKTLTVTAGTQRVWTFSGAVDIAQGDQVCWLGEADGAGGLDGEILWTSRALPSGLWSGAGQIAGG